MLIVWIILFSLLGSAGAVIAASVFLSFKQETQFRLIPLLLSFATGTLLCTAFIGLIPEAIESSEHAGLDIVPLLLATVLGGIVVFFILEKLVIWRHCHDRECEIHMAKSSGTMVLAGDTFHNVIDGVFIAASFLASIPLGIIASISVLSHEIPQELGDIGLLVHEGYSKRKAFSYNMISALSSLPAAIVTYFIVIFINQLLIDIAIPFIMVVAAASFIYISLADLIPEFHHEYTLKKSLRQLGLMVAGIIIIFILLQFHVH